MNRPIKFMAWDKENKKLYVPDYITGDNGTVFDYDGNNCSGTTLEPNDNDLYQFTGLLDKDGKEIYEGHLLYCGTWQPHEYRVEFREGGFCLCYGDGEETPIDITFLSDSTGVAFKIIGHIAEGE